MDKSKTLAKANKLLELIALAYRGIIFQHESVSFGLVIVLILMVQGVVLARGFVSVSADDHSRVLYAANWAQSPYIFGTDWLPGHFYLLGLALKVHYDLLLTPRIVTMLCSLASLGMLYLLARQLFNRWVALLSVLIVGLLPLHVHLSLTPLSDMMYYAFIISFLYFFLLWVDKGTERHLLIAACLLSVATSVRYEGWLIAALFSSYLALRWLRGLWSTRALHPRWLLAIGFACLFPCVWMLRSSIVGSPAFSSTSGFGSPIESITRLTTFPRLNFMVWLLQNGALICLLAVVGILLSHRLLARTLWLYLIYSLAPFVILTLATAGPWPWPPYAPRYVGLYIILLTPFCTYAIYWAVTADTQSFRCRWQTGQLGMLIMMSAYNVWLVYLRFALEQSWMLIGLLALVGIVLSYRLLDQQYWFYFTLSLSPLPLFIVLSRGSFVAGPLRLFQALYSLCLVLLYAYLTWRASGSLQPSSRHQWRIAGAGMLAIICLYHVWGTLVDIPPGMASVKAGLRVRELFEKGALARADKVLLEVATNWDYRGIQVMSNHPGNFILDRAPFKKLHSKKESFLLDGQSLPYEIGRSFTDFEAQANPFSLHPPFTLSEYLQKKQVHLILIKDQRLETLLTQQTGFEKIDQVEDYLFLLLHRTRH